MKEDSDDETIFKRSKTSKKKKKVTFSNIVEVIEDPTLDQV